MIQYTIDVNSLSLVYSARNYHRLDYTTSNLTAQTYNYNIKITDSYGKSQDYNSQTFTVAIKVKIQAHLVEISLLIL